MSKKQIDRLKVMELRDKGDSIVKIAETLGHTKGGVSKVLKEMGRGVTKAALVAAPEYERKKDAATEHLLFLADKAKTELEWIEKFVPPKTDAEYREWQNQKLKFAAEMRKLIAAMADIGYKLFQISEITEILRDIDKQIGIESKECQKRIRDRLQRRMDLKFPDFRH